jgi:hypothetical protein
LKEGEADRERLAAKKALLKSEHTTEMLTRLRWRSPRSSLQQLRAERDISDRSGHYIFLSDN